MHAEQDLARLNKYARVKADLSGIRESVGVGLGSCSHEVVMRAKH